MCGIVGMFQPGGVREDERATLHRMAGTIVHRGPDDGGVWLDARAGVGLASRRLAIVDLSPEGHQPMASASGDFVIAFNGEIYNHRDLRQELATLGAGRAPRFHGNSDTEVLLAAIEQWGLDDALQRAIGMFAFALWDRRRRTLLLVRDRLGEKPLYYGWMGETFLFGSELKALRIHPTFTGTVDRDALTLYLRYGYVPAPYSIYRGVSKLPPGSVLTVDADAVRNRPTPAPYWSAHRVAEAGVATPFPGSEAEAVDRLDALLRDAVRQQMVADVPVGAFLSGGIDSSTIVALMQAQSARPVRSFTIGFHEAGYNEAVDAKAVAARLATDHTELYVTPREAMEVIPLLPTLYDEPFADASQIPTFLVSRLARRQVKVALSGDGGDELFGGYTRHLWAKQIWRGVGWAPPRARAAAGVALSRLSPQQWDRVLTALPPILPNRFKQRHPGEKLHKLARSLTADDPDALYHMLVSRWDQPASVVIGGREPTPTFGKAAARSGLTDYAQSMMYLDLVGYLPDDILVKVDRASMGISLEARVPFLDHRVVEFAWQMPLSMKIHGGQGKRILRLVLDRYLPRELVERPKAGFTLPIGAWLSGPLRPWAEDLLSDARLRNDGFFEPVPIRKRWGEHLAGRFDWTYSLWSVLMFQTWLDAQRTHTPEAAIDCRASMR